MDAAERPRVCMRCSTTEAAGSDDHSPAGEAAIRAYLRLVAEALAATAGPATRDRASRNSPARCPRGSTRRGRSWTPSSSSWRTRPRTSSICSSASAQASNDPSVREVTRRRLRVQAWTRVFLRRVGEAAGDDGVAGASLEWMAARQDDLASLIFAMDRRAKEGEIARRGAEAVDAPDVVNRIGQAAMLQAHMRFLVEAIAATLPRRTG